LNALGFYPGGAQVDPEGAQADPGGLNEIHRTAQLGKIELKLSVCLIFWPNPGPGRLPLGLGHQDRISRCFCVCSALGDQFRVQTYILEPCKKHLKVN